MTGVLLACQYGPGFDVGYLSLRSLVADTILGYLVQSMHANGASVVMAMLFYHLLRTHWYGHSSARLGFYGAVMLVLLVAVCFTGYTLAASQMSYWAAAVIFRMFSAIPVYGDALVEWLLAGTTPSSYTLYRIFVLHVLLPFVVLLLILLHVFDLHQVNSSADALVRLDLPRSYECDFHPYVAARDALALCALLSALTALCCFYPEWLNHPDTWVPANPLVTPAHIQPEWYFMLLYSVLRAVPSKSIGLLLLVAFIGSLLAHIRSVRTVQSRSKQLLLRVTGYLSLLDFVAISYLCINLHEYDAFAPLMLCLVLSVTLYRVSVYTDATPVTAGTAVSQAGNAFTATRVDRNVANVVVRASTQEGSKVPSMWSPFLYLWCVVVWSFGSLRALEAASTFCTPTVLLLLLLMVVLPTLTYALDASTTSRNSIRAAIISWFCILLFELLVFLSLGYVIFEPITDPTQPLSPAPTALSLDAMLPPTMLALYVLLTVTWAVHYLTSLPVLHTSCDRLCFGRALCTDVSLATAQRNVTAKRFVPTAKYATQTQSKELHCSCDPGTCTRCPGHREPGHAYAV